MKTSNGLRRRATAQGGAGRRALVRSIFAYIEGTSFGFRSAALHMARVRRIGLDIGEIMMAREITFSLSDKGKVEERRILSAPLANLRFALALFAKVAGIQYQFPAGDSNFERLQEIQHVRNRLVHPKNCEDLKVTAEEKAMAIAAAAWVEQEQLKVLKALAYRLHSGLGHFHSGIKSLPTTDSGGYAVTALEDLFLHGLTASHPISDEEVEAWIESFVKKE